MIDYLCSSDNDSFPINDKVRAINNYYDDLFVRQILKAGSRQADDSNYSILAEKTTSFSVGDRQFTKPEEALFIEHLEITDQNGEYRPLKRIDKASGEGAWQVDENGQPYFFDEHGETFTFDVPAEYAGTIRMWFSRQPELFDVADTTKTPGFQRVLHQYLAYGPSVDQCTKFHQERVPLYEKRVEELRSTAKKLVGKAKIRVRPKAYPRNAFK